MERRDPKGGSDLEKDLKLIHSDPRFAHVTSDPKFHHIPKKERKVKLDSRFHSILTDEKFYEKSTMDPRGRKGNYSTKEDLLRFYHLSSDEDSEEEEEEEEESSEEEKEVMNKEGDDFKVEGKQKKKKEKELKKEDDEEEEEEQEIGKKKEKGKEKSVSKDSSGESGKDEEEEEEQEAEEEKDEEEDTTQRDQEERSKVAPEITKRLQDMTRDYARGGGNLFSSDSSDDDSTTTDEEEEGEEEFEWAELDQDAVWDNEAEVEETSRIAICNLDWDRIKAADLMVLFSSFCPMGGSVKQVAIYPSEYGKKRMAEEDRSGPQELTGMVHRGRKDHQEEEEEEEEDERERRDTRLDLVDLEKLEKGKLDETAGATKRDFEALRRYQRNRLRYFYAVMECDSVATARALYQECDRQPFEGAGILLDLRYIPSDMSFEETPHDLCQTVPCSYKAKNFITTALQNTRPSLTWDETDPERYKALSSAMTQALKGGTLDEDRLKDFVASSSGEEEEEDEEKEDNDDSSDEEKEEVKAERIAKFRALIREIDEKEKRKKEKEIDMEEIFDDIREEEEEKEDKDEEEEEADENQAQLNPFEKYLEKRKAKRKERKKKQKENKKREEDEESDEGISDDDVPGGVDSLYSDPFFAQVKKVTKKKGKKKVDDEEETEEDNEKNNLELLLMEEDKEDKRHFNMREIIKNSETTKKRRKNKLKKKMLEKKEQKNKALDDFEVNMNDPRFSELLTSGDYNIDPSHPQFKRTQAMDKLIGEIQRKRMAESGEEVPGAKRPCLGDATQRELSTLVQRVKRKAGRMKGASKGGT
ncbi:hypothetical protein O3P69_004879 [Scylla paramamosain]|uniref:NUC153 domain-containing protein n=1 Tax=Scylla paramamosain TaxID=85552 RepID=A0AAW0UBK9_SCYPA